MTTLSPGRWRKLWIPDNAGHFFFLLMGFLAVWLHMERMATFDSSGYLFNLLSEEDFFYPHQRHGALIVQLIPLLLLKMGASLHTVMIAFSLSFVLIYYLCWLFVRYVARHRGAGIAIILVSILSVKYTFYWPVTEIFQGLIYSLAAYGWIAGARHRSVIVYYPVVLLFVAAAILVHPLSVIPLFFALGYDYLDQKRFRDTRIYILAGLIAGFWLAFRMLKTPSAYETELMGQVKNMPNVLLHFFELPGPRTFLKYLVNVYWLGTLAGVAVAVFLIIRRSWLKLVLYLGSLAFFSLLINSVFPLGNSKVVIENMMLPLSFFTVLILSNEVLPSLKVWRLEYPLIILMVAMGLSRILAHRGFFDYRFQWQDTVAAYLDQFPEQKLIIDERNMPSKADHFMVTWATSAETLVRSAVKRPGDPFVLFMANPDLMSWFREQENTQIRFPYAHFWRTRWHKELPASIPLAEQPFRFAQQADSLGLPELQSRILSMGLSMELKDRVGDNQGKRIYASVKLDNTGGQEISSHLDNPHPLYLTYQWIRQGNSLNAEGPLIPLWADIPPAKSLFQLVDLYIPADAQDTQLQWSLRTEPPTVKQILATIPVEKIW